MFILYRFDNLDVANMTVQNSTTVTEEITTKIVLGAGDYITSDTADGSDDENWIIFNKDWISPITDETNPNIGIAVGSINYPNILNLHFIIQI